MIKIFANNYIETGFSVEDAENLERAIKAVYSSSQKEKIEIDFSGVKFFTTQFFNNSIGKFILTLSPEIFDSIFTIVNLSEAGQATFLHSYDNAVSYYNLPPEKRLLQDEIINQDEEL